MIELDGSYGEGGGQIIRTALALSAITGEPVKIVNIRAKRDPPGLKEQHLNAIKAMQKLTDAEVSGASVGSKEIVFVPGEICGGNISLSISTAGSVGLILQPLLIAGLFAKKEVIIKIKGGGTWVKWAPPLKYIDRVLTRFLSRFGYHVEINEEVPGFYPAGGAKASIIIKPRKLSRITALQFGELVGVEIFADGSEELSKRKVLERMVSTARLSIYNHLGISPKVQKRYYKTQSVGCGILVVNVGEEGIHGNSALCRLGVRAEDVAREALEFSYNRALDKHLGDQIVPFLALFGGEVTVEEITQHLKTNVWVCNQFLPESVKLVENENTIIGNL